MSLYAKAMPAGLVLAQEFSQVHQIGGFFPKKLCR
jgi:hypothetical protein